MQSFSSGSIVSEIISGFSGFSILAKTMPLLLLRMVLWAT